MLLRRQRLLSRRTRLWVYHPQPEETIKSTVDFWATVAKEYLRRHCPEVYEEFLKGLESEQDRERD